MITLENISEPTTRQLFKRRKVSVITKSDLPRESTKSSLVLIRSYSTKFLSQPQ